MLHRSTLLSGAALLAVMFALVGCDMNDQSAPEERTITQSPDPQQPQDTRGDTRDQTTGADGIDVERDSAPDAQPPETRQPQDDSEGIEVEPER